MKKNNYILFCAILLLFTACSKLEVKPPSQFTVNGVQKNVSVGIIEDNGTTDISYRSYAIELKSIEGDKPENSLVFTIHSNTTTRLDEGTYPYSYDIQRGVFSQPQVKFDVKYDAVGVAISGTLLKESDLDTTASNSILVTKEGDNKLFTITLNFIKGSQKYIVTGRFNEALKEGYVSIN